MQAFRPIVLSPPVRVIYLLHARNPTARDEKPLRPRGVCVPVHVTRAGLSAGAVSVFRGRRLRGALLEVGHPSGQRYPGALAHAHMPSRMHVHARHTFLHACAHENTRAYS